MDVVGATLLLIAASPIMIISAFLIRFTSKGNALFVQDRYGYNGRVFKLYKFRTMVQDADAMQEALRQQNELDGAAFKIKSDPRITGVGKWLRKTSIDELPQLLNVIKGDMSLVGPRPLPLPDYQRFKEISHMRRLSVLPGITCTWQAGGRNNVSFEEWMKLDMDYIDNWSLGGDIKILLKTVPAVLFARGAS
jgi:lipopolysaccharide/colanic/teichoic acid biosynthesis glycosyltransferase